MENVMSTHDAPTIMVLEPEVLLRMALSEYLRDCGYRVIEGVKVVDVWAVIQAGVTLNVVFVRAQPDGFALASKLRQTQPGTDVILYSGVADAVEKSSALCNRGPTKAPYRPKTVARRIEQLLAERQRSLKRKGA
jgi:DNA-binding NtrC family response regulator